MISYEGGQAKSERTKDEKVNLILQRFNSFSEKEKRFVLNLLHQEAKNDKLAKEAITKIKKLHYETIPLSFKEWANNPDYSSSAGPDLYDEYVEDGLNITTDDYNDVVITGGIGSGKSFFASLLGAYEMYRFTCLRNPQRSFGLAANSTIYYLLASLYKNHAIENIYGNKVRPILEESPYFNELGVDTRESGEVFFPSGLKVVSTSAKPEDVIGYDLFGIIIDEANFGKNNNIVEVRDDGTKVTRIEKAYSALSGRQKSRFLSQGFLPGYRIVVSSKNTEKDFTSKLVTENRNDPQIYVIDNREWDVKPDSKYSGETFRVFYGGMEQQSRILEEGEDPPESDNPNTQVIEVPIEYYEEFKTNLKRALRDIAGVSVPSVHPFIPDYNVIRDMWAYRSDSQGHPNDKPHIVSTQIEDLDWDQLCKKERTEEAGFVETNYTPRIHPDKARFLHIDPSKGINDNTGVVMGHKVKDVEIVMRDNDTGEAYKEKRPLIYIDLVLQVNPPNRGHIKFKHLRKLVYSLESHGFNLKKGVVSMDSWNTSDTISQLNDQGFRAMVISVDEDNEPYNLVSDTLYEGRYSCYKHPTLKRELEGLEKDEELNKVDHQSDGSKDVADALAGVTYSIHRVGSRKKSYDAGSVNKRRDKTHPMENYQSMGSYQNWM